MKYEYNNNYSDGHLNPGLDLNTHHPHLPPMDPHSHPHHLHPHNLTDADPSHHNSYFHPNGGNLNLNDGGGSGGDRASYYPHPLPPDTPCQGLDCYPDGVFTAVETVTVVLALGGFLGNGLTVLAILTSGLRSNLNSILIGNLSFACLLYCCLVLPLQAVAYHHRQWVLPDNVCVGEAAVRIWLIGVNMSLLAAIAFYR